MKIRFNKVFEESFKKGFPMKENDNCENELDDVDAEMDDEKEFAKKKIFLMILKFFGEKEVFLL